jgi:chloride channel protein, CIC family
MRPTELHQRNGSTARGRLVFLVRSVRVPRRLRALVRAREISLVVLAAIIGAAGGLVVASMSALVQVLHVAFFGIGGGERLSARPQLGPLVAILVPALGGLALGLAGRVIRRYRPAQEVDPIEANALHGGRMSLRGSLIVAAQTVWSSGVGASVGLEAGYTQLASAIASFVGRHFRLRRGDLRILVGCGAAGGIAGGFGAPVAGAFYAYELVIGSYSVASLAQVVVAAVVGFLVSQQFTTEPLGIFVGNAVAISSRDLTLVGVLGLLAGLFGIAVMRAVAVCEKLFAHVHVPAALCPLFGGILVGLCACVSPQVMSSGHGALHLSGLLDRPLRAIGIVLLLKSIASVVSLGSGFRGGLFFTSLLLGALAGHFFASALGAFWPGIVLDTRAYSLIGMAALSASIIGAPLTMTFIALETTGDLQLTAAALIAVVLAVLVTRELFGYSFATWRFHLRGETIRSAADVGWMRDLTVGRMMRRHVVTAPVDMPAAAFRVAFPLGSEPRIVAVANDGRYAGIVPVAEAHAAELPETTRIGVIAQNAGHVLLPDMSIKTAMQAFDEAEAEALAVVDSSETRQVIGILTEAHAVRRYAEESELRRRELFGEA